MHQSIKDQPSDFFPRLAKVTGVIFALVVLSLIFIMLQKDRTPAPAGENKVAPQIMTPNAQPRAKLYVEPDTNASRQAAAWREADPAGAAAMDKLAAVPQAKWFTSTQSLQAVDAYVQAAAAAQAIPVLVAYYIPDRDCNGYSAGGAASVADYKAYIGELSSRIGDNKAIIILEPDALPSVENMDANGQACLTDEQRATRYELLSFAVNRLKQQSGVTVYIDAGHSAWVKDVKEMARRLYAAGVAKADGFSLNVSNFQPTRDENTYGQTLGRELDGKHFVIDTSRNGNGAYRNTVYPDYGWCNPPERALGNHPALLSGTQDLLDAYLYVKVPGESDGQDADQAKCFGGPPAGQWWPEYAVGLVNRWPNNLQSR